MNGDFLHFKACIGIRRNSVEAAETNIIVLLLHPPKHTHMRKKGERLAFSCFKKDHLVITVICMGSSWEIGQMIFDHF